jgi:hypothetical protein
VLRAFTIAAIAGAAVMASGASDARSDSIDAGLSRCAPLHFTQSLAGAIAGRPIAIRYVENRSKEGQKEP